MGNMIVVGSVNVDLVVRVAELPSPGQTVTGGTFARTDGGKGANAAVAAARWGADVRFVGAVGADDHGARARRALSEEGIDTSGLIELGETTGVAVIVVDADGENQIAVAPGANASLAAEHLRGLEPSAGGVLCANLEISDEAIVAAAERCTTAGMRFVLDPAPAREVPDEILDLAPILVPNFGEARSLSGELNAEPAAVRLHERTGAPVVVTLGSAGALLVDTDGISIVPAPVVEAVDATGAGDTFCGVLAAEIATGADVRSGTRTACRAAAMSVTEPGARGGMPTRQEPEAWS